MEINQNKVVELIYTLEVDGKVEDQTTEERPLGFIFGTGSLLPKFEENVLNKKVGDEFAFVLTPEDGYGVASAENIVELPKNIFEHEGSIKEGLLEVGNVIPMMTQAGGVVPGKVQEVKEETVMMDFNHPMAGKTLNFSGKIITVREATEKELQEGLYGERAPKADAGCDPSACSSCGGGCH